MPRKMYLLERLNFQQQELDFTREESVAVTHARLRPGSARYLGAASRPSGQPEQIMTKAKTKTQLSTEDNGSLTEAATPAVSTKCPRGADRDGAAKAAPVAAGNSVSAATIVPTPKPPRQTKSVLLRTRLSEPGGASLASLIALTGWQAHTLRAALSGLRKEGLSLTRRRDGDDTIYAIETTGHEAPNTDGQTTVPEPEGTVSVLTEGAHGSADLASASASAGDDA